MVGSTVAVFAPRARHPVEESPDDPATDLMDLASRLGDARLRARLRIRDEQNTIHEVGEDQAVGNREDRRSIDNHEIRSTALLEHLAHPI